MENYKIGIVTVSDRSFVGEREDISGAVIEKYLRDCAFSGEISTIKRITVPDEISKIKDALIELCDENRCNLVLTTGGTGCAPRDVTPEATMAVATKVVPGIAEAIRMYSLSKTKHAMLSRGVSVIRNNTLIINFAGSPKACTESLDVIIEALPHAIGLIRGEKLDS